MERYVEFQLVIPLIGLVQFMDKQRHVGSSEEEAVAVRHVSDCGLFVKRHQRGSDAARPSVGPSTLDLNVVQREASLNREEDGFAFNAMMDGERDVDEVGADVWGGKRRGGGGKQI